MEKEAGMRILARSEEQNIMKYAVFVGDGDAKTLPALQEMKNKTGPYDIPLAKEECVNHVGKRL